VIVNETLDIGKRESVVEAIAQALIAYIATKNLKPGDKLPSERELVEMVGASRLPLREALCILKGLGIVETKHGKGIFLRHLDTAALFGMLSPLLRTQADIDVAHILQVRLHLEATIAELAADNRSDDNVAALADALEGMSDCLVDDRRAYIEHDMAFHQELARSTGNPIFLVFMASITDLLTELQFMYQDSVAYRQEAVKEHEGILRAVRDRAAGPAREAMQQHIRNAGERI